MLLRRLIAALDGDVQALYDALELPFRPRFFPVVQHLRLHPSTTVSALVEHCGVSQPAVTQTLREMRRAGLIEVTAGKDRRERRIALSRDGAALSERLRPVWTAVAQAAAALDAELTAPLGPVIEAALARLAERRFLDRIRQEMTE